MVFKKIINDPYKVVDEMVDGIVLAHHDILKFASNNKVIILVVLFALLVRVVFFMAGRLWDEQVLSDLILVYDAAGYHNLALDLLQLQCLLLG